MLTVAEFRLEKSGRHVIPQNKMQNQIKAPPTHETSFATHNLSANKFGSVGHPEPPFKHGLDFGISALGSIVLNEDVDV